MSDYAPTDRLMWSASRKASATIVSVRLAEPEDGKNGTAGNVKIPDTVDATVRIHHASFGTMAMRVAPCDGSHSGHDAH
jgi:hypothetical protein